MPSGGLTLKRPGRRLRNEIRRLVSLLPARHARKSETPYVVSYCSGAQSAKFVFGEFSPQGRVPGGGGQTFPLIISHNIKFPSPPPSEPIFFVVECPPSASSSLTHELNRTEPDFPSPVYQNL